jgi:hypothetical protein
LSKDILWPSRVPDYVAVAARLAALKDPEIRNFVSRWQLSHLAPLYTRERILGQLEAGIADGSLSPAANNFAMPVESLSHSTAISDRAAMGTTPEEEAVALRRIRSLEQVLAAAPLPPIATELPKEIADNFVTLYDLQAYNALLEAATLLPTSGQATADSVAGSEPDRHGVGCRLHASTPSCGRSEGASLIFFSLAAMATWSLGRIFA